MIGRIIGFIKTPAGAAIVFLLAMFTLFYFVREYRERHPGEGETSNRLGQMSPEEAKRDPNAALTSEWVKEGKLDKFNPPADSAPRAPNVRQKPAAPAEPAALPELVHMFREAEEVPAQPEPAKPPRVFAPPGTLIPCQLVITVDSSSLETPVVGVVTEDVWHNQRLIIAAGTEVHSFARHGRVRDRIEVTGTWKFVRQDGREVRINAIALDREYDPDRDSYSLTDGSAGIRGTVTKTDEFLEFKMFAATAIAGASRNAKKTTRTVFGEFENSSLSNAAIDGASSVADRYAKLMLDQIEGDGLFVRVPAGTEFYVYTLQVFEPKLASVAGLKQGQRPVNSWQTSRLDQVDPGLPASIRQDKEMLLPLEIKAWEERSRLERAAREKLQVIRGDHP